MDVGRCGDPDRAELRRPSTLLCAVLAILGLTGCPDASEPIVDSATASTSGSTTGATTDPGSGGLPTDPMTDGEPTTLSTGATPPDTSSTTTGASTGAGTGTSNTDGSTSDGTTGEEGFCGDGLVDDSEECDNGVDNDNKGECTKLCKLPFCGDGFHQPGEECDNGVKNHPSAYGGCTPECILGPRCGDGTTDKPYEACDPEDPQFDDTAACVGCQWSGKRAFASSVGYTGDLGGVLGADSKCQKLAELAGIAGEGVIYRAWLSSPGSSASERMTKSLDAPYLLTSGTIVADDWDDLVDGSLNEAIDLDEHGEPAPYPYAWTNTTTSGDLGSVVEHCADWSHGGLAHKGQRGLTSEVSPEWTAAESNNPVYCSKSGVLYCLEQ